MLNLLIGYFLKLTFREKSRWSQVQTKPSTSSRIYCFSLLSNAEKKRKGKHNIVVAALTAQTSEYLAKSRT
jgi:hypothetical protein